MARVTVELNDRLLDSAASLFKGKTRDELITIALVELVDKYEQKNLYDLFYDDEILIAEDYDYKALRRGSIRDSSDGGVDILDGDGVYYEKSGDRPVDSEAGFGSSDAGFGGSDAGFGGSDAGFGGSDAGFGGSDAEFGGSDTGFGSSDAGFGGSDAGFGGSDLSSDFGDDLTGNADDFSYSEDSFENDADSFNDSEGHPNDFS